MFSSFFLVLASVHSFTFVAATPEPQITQAPSPHAKRQDLPQLSTIHFPFTALPDQVYPFAVGRGPQYGYNQCNSTTQGSDSKCQTLIFNGPTDFCLWGSPTPNGTIGDTEAKVVSYCTRNIHGSRPIPFDAITGLQYMKTSAYIQVTGYIANSAIGLTPDDQGGELDPHGADLQGNPLGGVVYSNATSDATNGTLAQVYNWNTFVGGNRFCMKVCYNSITAPDYCQNRYDLIGCDYNMPSNVQNGSFTSCEGELQDVVGVYSVNGVTSTWSMPETLNGPPPYTPRVPASSNCQTFQATDLFAFTSTTSGSAKATSTGLSGSGSSGTNTGTGSGATSTGTSSALSSIGVPPAFYALGLGMMAGVALVL